MDIKRVEKVAGPSEKEDLIEQIFDKMEIKDAEGNDVKQRQKLRKQMDLDRLDEDELRALLLATPKPKAGKVMFDEAEEAQAKVPDPDAE